MKTTITFAFAIFFSIALFAQKDMLDKHFKDIQSSDIFILGSFHFANPKLDTYKPKYEIDIFSAEKQQELATLLKEIKKFNPTKIAVEVRATSQKRLDSLYTAYLNGTFELRSSETFQIGFRLAKILGHKKVYAIDAPARRYKSNMTDAEYKEKENSFIQKTDKKLLRREFLIDETYTKLYEADDKLKTEVSLLDYFKFMNDRAIVNNSHGHYLVGEFKMGEREKGDYFGADNSLWWYNRNLRIFQNLLNINQPGKDRIFVLIGAGHLPILQFLADTSIDFNHKRFSEIVKK